MRFFSRKVFQGRALCTHILFFVLFASLLVACGDDSVSRPNEDSKDNPELSSKREDSKSSSSSRSHRRSSSSSVKGKVSSSSSIKIELPPEDGLDIVYVFEDGTVSGAVALDYFAKGSKISLVQLDPSDAYKETKTVFTSEVKNGTYEIKNIKLQQPIVKLSVDGSIKSVLNDKYANLSFVALGDVTSGEIFNLNMITTLEANRVLNLLSGRKISFENAKKKAAEDVWNMFHLEAFDYDNSELIHVSDISESGAALLAATVLLQAGAGDDFAKFLKSLTTDVARDGKWDDASSRLSIADWALSNDLNDGYASIRKTLESRMGKAAKFETHLRNFYLTELDFPECDAESAGDVFYVKNKLSSFYTATYNDVSKSKERFVCDEQKGWKAIPDSLKDFMGDATPAKDGDVRRGTFTGDFFTYDGTKKEWRKSTALEKDRYFVLASNAKTFVDIQDVYESIKDDERVIFVLRHAERGDDTSKSGTLTDNGKKQSEEVGARLKKFKEDFVLGGSEFLRAHQTVMAIAKGRGQSYDTRDTIPQLNDDWYTKNSEEVEKAKSECGGGWEVTSKYAYTGAYSTGANAAYYNLAERSVELIEDVLLKKYTKEKFVLLSSHDKLMVPLVAYCSNLQIPLKKYDGGKWINYLAGVAIIIDKSGNRRYVAVRGLKSGFAD